MTWLGFVDAIKYAFEWKKRCMHAFSLRKRGIRSDRQKLHVILKEPFLERVWWSIFWFVNKCYYTFKENLIQTVVDVHSRYMISRPLRTKSRRTEMTSIFIEYGSLQSYSRANRHNTIHQSPLNVTSMASLPSDTVTLHSSDTCTKKVQKYFKI